MPLIPTYDNRCSVVCAACIVCWMQILERYIFTFILWIFIFPLQIGCSGLASTLLYFYFHSSSWCIFVLVSFFSSKSNENSNKTECVPVFARRTQNAIVARNLNGNDFRGLHVHCPPFTTNVCARKIKLNRIIRYEYVSNVNLPLFLIWN